MIERKLTLPTDSNARKDIPMFRGCLLYFAAALAGVARISKQGNDRHNPGQPIHHARGKSNDHGDCVIRHMTDIADLLAARERGDTTVTAAQILDEVDQFSWRALAVSQEIHEMLGAPMAPGARRPVPAAQPEPVDPSLPPWTTVHRSDCYLGVSHFGPCLEPNDTRGVGTVPSTRS